MIAISAADISHGADSDLGMSAAQLGHREQLLMQGEAIRDLQCHLALYCAPADKESQEHMQGIRGRQSGDLALTAAAVKTSSADAVPCFAASKSPLKFDSRLRLPEHHYEETKSLTSTSCGTRGAADSVRSLSNQQAADILHCRLTPNLTPRVDQQMSDSSDGGSDLSDFGLSDRQLQDVLHKHGHTPGRGAEMSDDCVPLDAGRAESGTPVEVLGGISAVDRATGRLRCNVEYSPRNAEDHPNASKMPFNEGTDIEHLATLPLDLAAASCSQGDAHASARRDMVSSRSDWSDVDSRYRYSASNAESDYDLSARSAQEAAERYRRYRDALQSPDKLPSVRDLPETESAKADVLSKKSSKLAGTSCLEALEDDELAWLWSGRGEQGRQEELSERSWAGTAVEAELAGLTPSEKPPMEVKVLGSLWWTHPTEAWVRFWSKNKPTMENWTESISCTFRER